MVPSLAGAAILPPASSLSTAFRRAAQTIFYIFLQRILGVPDLLLPIANRPLALILLFGLVFDSDAWFFDTRFCLLPNFWTRTLIQRTFALPDAYILHILEPPSSLRKHRAFRHLPFSRLSAENIINFWFGFIIAIRFSPVFSFYTNICLVSHQSIFQTGQNKMEIK